MLDTMNVFRAIEYLKYSKRNVDKRKETHWTAKLKAKSGGDQLWFFGS